MQKNAQLQLDSAKSQSLSHLNVCKTRSLSFTGLVLDVESCSSCSWNNEHLASGLTFSILECQSSKKLRIFQFFKNIKHEKILKLPNLIVLGLFSLGH